MPLDQDSMNIVCIFIDWLGKYSISVPYNKSVDARVLAQLYLIYIYKYYRPTITIVSDCSLQFIAAFWEEFCRLLGTKLKLSIAYHP